MQTKEQLRKQIYDKLEFYSTQKYIVPGRSNSTYRKRGNAKELSGSYQTTQHSVNNTERNISNDSQNFFNLGRRQGHSEQTKNLRVQTEKSDEQCSINASYVGKQGFTLNNINEVNIIKQAVKDDRYSFYASPFNFHSPVSDTSQRINTSFQSTLYHSVKFSPNAKSLTEKSPDQSYSNKVQDTSHVYNELIPRRLLRNPKLKIHKNYKIVSSITINQEQLIQGLKEKQFFKIFELMKEPLTLCQDCQELKAFGKILRFLASFAQYTEKFDQAMFIFNQCLMFAEYTRQYKLKVNCLIDLAECARKLKQYQISLNLLRKALSYSWHIRNLKKELHIYDLMGNEYSCKQQGLSYFYLGNIEKARLYHKKFWLGSHQTGDSYLVVTSSKHIMFYERHLNYYSESFCYSLMLKFSLPIYNRFQRLKVTQTNYLFDKELKPSRELEDQCDYNKQITIHQCDGMTILNELCESYEFVKFDLLNSLQATEVSETGQNTKKNILKFKFKDRTILCPEAYSISNKVEAINKNKEFYFKLEDLTLLERIKVNVQGNVMPFGEVQDKIYMSHLQNKSLDQDLVDLRSFKKYYKFLLRLIEYLVGEKKQTKLKPTK